MKLTSNLNVTIEVDPKDFLFCGDCEFESEQGNCILFNIEPLEEDEFTWKSKRCKECLDSFKPTIKVMEERAAKMMKDFCNSCSIKDCSNCSVNQVFIDLNEAANEKA